MLFSCEEELNLEQKVLILQQLSRPEILCTATVQHRLMKCNKTWQYSLTLTLFTMTFFIFNAICLEQMHKTFHFTVQGNGN